MEAGEEVSLQSPNIFEQSVWEHWSYCYTSPVSITEHFPCSISFRWRRESPVLAILYISAKTRWALPDVAAWIPQALLKCSSIWPCRGRPSEGHCWRAFTSLHPPMFWTRLVSAFAQTMGKTCVLRLCFRLVGSGERANAPCSSNGR